MSDLVVLRRQQIVAAAESVIIERGLQHLSLAEIEKKAGMSRGQLTYYFPTKEEILLAVFDRCVENIHRRIAGPLESIAAKGIKGWPLVREIMAAVVRDIVTEDPFYPLEYTFLAQVGYRKDFGRRLNDLYSHWRSCMAADLDCDADPAVVSNLMVVMQGFLHGLAIQRMVDPGIIDSGAVTETFLVMVDLYLERVLKHGTAISGDNTACEFNSTKAKILAEVVQ